MNGGLNEGTQKAHEPIINSAKQNASRVSRFLPEHGVEPERKNEIFLRQTMGLHSLALLKKLESVEVREKIIGILMSADKDPITREIVLELEDRIAEILANPDLMEKKWSKRQPREEGFFSRDYSSGSAFKPKGEPMTREQLDAMIARINETLN